MAIHKTTKPPPKWLRSTRTAYILFGFVYLFLSILATVWYVLSVRIIWQHEKFDEFLQEFCLSRFCVPNGYWMLLMWSCLNIITIALGLSLISYGIFFVTRDSYRQLKNRQIVDPSNRSRIPLHEVNYHPSPSVPTHSPQISQRKVTNTVPFTIKPIETSSGKAFEIHIHS